MQGEGVLVGVGGGVVGLAAVAGDADEGGEHDEEIEVGRETGVQVPAALDFGARDGLPVVGGHVFKGRVLEVHGALDDAADWGMVGSADGDGLLELVQVADIALVYADLDTLGFEIDDEGSGVWAVGS